MKLCRLLPITMAAVIAFSLLAMARPPAVQPGFSATFEPIQMPSGPGMVELRVTAKDMWCAYLDSAFQLEIETFNGLTYSGPNPIVRELD